MLRGARAGSGGFAAGGRQLDVRPSERLRAHARPAAHLVGVRPVGTLVRL